MLFGYIFGATLEDNYSAIAGYTSNGLFEGFWMNTCTFFRFNSLNISRAVIGLFFERWKKLKNMAGIIYVS